MASGKQPRLTPNLHVDKSTCEHTHVLALIHTLWKEKSHNNVGQAVVALRFTAEVPILERWSHYPYVQRSFCVHWDGLISLGRNARHEMFSSGDPRVFIWFHLSLTLWLLLSGYSRRTDKPCCNCTQERGSWSICETEQLLGGRHIASLSTMMRTHGQPGCT